MTGDMPGVFCWTAGLEPFGIPLDEGEKESMREETYESGIVEETKAIFFRAGERNQQAKQPKLLLPFICLQWRLVHNNYCNYFSQTSRIYRANISSAAANSAPLIVGDDDDDDDDILSSSSKSPRATIRN